MIKIACAACTADLRHPDNDLNFRLELFESTKYSNKHFPWEDSDHHFYFCDYNCLVDWLNADQKVDYLER